MQISLTIGVKGKCVPYFFYRSVNIFIAIPFCITHGMKFQPDVQRLQILLSGSATVLSLALVRCLWNISIELNHSIDTNREKEQL